MQEKTKVVLTPEQIWRLLGLPDDVQLAGMSATSNPPGVSVEWFGPWPQGWQLPAVLDGTEQWVPGRPIVSSYSIVHVFGEGS